MLLPIRIDFTTSYNPTLSRQWRQCDRDRVLVLKNLHAPAGTFDKIDENLKKAMAA
jgi:hypothetical protein